MSWCRSIFLFFVTCLAVSCNEIGRNKLLYIEIFYPKGPIETRLPLNCNDIQRMNRAIRVDTVIINRSDLIGIVNNLKNLKGIKLDSISLPCDIRTVCIFKYSNKDSIRLCIGKFNCILKNNINMDKNDTLVYLIRKCSGYYNYFQKEDLIYCDEVRKFGIPEDYKDFSFKNDSLGVPISPMLPK